MNRREFLQRMGLLGLAVATPKIIFDLGANRYKDKLTVEHLKRIYEDLKKHPGTVQLNPEYETVPYEEILIHYDMSLNSIVSERIIESPFKVNEIMYPRRFNLVDNNWKEVLPFKTFAS